MDKSLLNAAHRHFLALGNCIPDGAEPLVMA